MALALFVSAIGSVAYDALLAQGEFRFVSRVFVATSLLQVALLAALLRSGLWCAPAVSLLTATIWGCALWRWVVAKDHVNIADIRGIVSEFARMTVLSAAVATGFMRYYPAPHSWAAVATEGSIVVVCLACGYLLSSRIMRTIASEELVMTLRLFRAA
jgi:O-antigen/teichoic acid export membrane protein